jgi:hypothetical protein
MNVTFDNLTATGVRLNFTSVAGDAAQIQIQLSPSREFSFAAGHDFKITAGASTTVSGLNQLQTYFGRAREITAGGVMRAWVPVFGFRTAAGTAQDLTPPAIFQEPALIVVPEKILSIEVNNPVAGYAALNLLHDGPAPARIAGVGGGPSYTIYIQTAGAPVDTLALMGTNGAEALTVTISSGTTKASTDANTAHLFQVPFRASANLPGRFGYHGLFRLPAIISARWWRIQIQGAMPGTMLEAKYLALGKALKSKNYAADKRETFNDLGVMDRDYLGVPDRLPGIKTRSVEFEIATMTETVYETTYGDLHDRAGYTDPVLVVPNSKPGAFLHDRILFGVMSGGQVSNPVSKYHTRRFKVDSII